MAGAAVKRNAAVFGGLLFVLVIAVLSISVVTLVKVFSDPATTGSNPQNDNGDGGGPTVTSQKPDDGRKEQGSKKDPVNVPQPRTIDQQSNPLKFDGFSSFAKQLGKTVNITADPCNNFYEYACGSYKEPIGFDVLAKKNHKLIATQFNKAAYIRDYSTPKPVKQAFYFYKSCVAAYKNWDSFINGGKLVRDKVSAFRQVINVDFPALTSTSTSTNSPAPYESFPDPKTFARAIGHLKYIGFLQTLVAIDVDTNWRNPQNYLPYALFVDQPKLVYTNTYYIKYWDHLRDNYFNDTYNLLANYARISNVQVDESQLRRDVQGILDLEFRIATRVNTPITERRKFDRQYNPMTTKEASQKYSWLDWDVLINESYRGPELQYYQFVVQEPGVFATIWDKVKSMKTFRNRDIYNYLYFRLILANRNYLPNPSPTAFKYQYFPDAPNENGFIGHRLPKPLFPFPPPSKETGERSDDEISDLCITQNIWGLQYANARVMIDAMFSSKAERDDLRDRVGKIIASIVDAFHAMVTQLDWMSDNTKLGAYNKLAHLVKNIAYPDFVVVDSPTDSDGKPQKSLPGHYDWLDIDEDDDYATILNKINVFKHKITFARLTQYDSNDRQDFDNPPAIVNAWYQDTLNSITFPLGILQKPFYDADYPMSVNFGGLGVVAGHELTHGFDDKGVQWDGTGVLRSWMDTTSQTSFNTMAQCVVKQYNGFQPISDLNIDGTQTQGENIADNGGIRAAHRAYQAYVALYGPDPQLPDETFGAFTQDQLFFLSFAQAWCRKDPAEVDLARQLLVDAHSPAKYRVMGTIQNFPAFRTAFNCPAGSIYSPNNQCKVWVSDSKSVTGIPPTTTTLPPHNIPTVPQAKYPDWNKSWEDDYEGLRIDYFTDTSQDPCTDFYTYSCGAYEMFYTPPIQRNEFVNAETDVMDALATGLKKEIDEFSDPIPVQQVKKFFGKCQEANRNWTNYLKSYNKTKNAIELLEIWTGVTFPTFYVAPALGTDTDDNDTGGNNDGDDDTPGPVKGWLEPYTLTMVLAGLSGFLDTDTIITPFVDTNWGDPQGVEPYLLHIDQAQLSLPTNYYKGKAWELVKNNYKLDVLTMLLRFQKVRNDTLPATDVLKSDIEDILQFEWTLANKLMINESLRTVNRSRSYNPMWLDDADDTIDTVWIWYYAAWLSLGGPEGLLMEVIYDNLKVNLAEPGYLRSLSTSLSDKNAFGFTPRQFINYLFYRLVRTNREYLPPLSVDETTKAQQLYVEMWPNDALQIGDMGVDLVDRPLLVRPIVGPPRFVRSLNRNLGIWKSRGGSDGDFRCVLDTVQRMGPAAARIYLNEVWPDVRKFQTARSLVGEMVENIGIAFRSMVDQLTWMSADAKVRASNKISQLVKNVGVPDFVLDDSQLTDYYAEMTIDEKDSYLDIMNNLTRINLLKKWGHLGRTGRGTRRDEYTHAAVVADAWYQAHLNSLTIGAPLLTFPYFSTQWPTSVNYGTLGAMIGNRIAQALSPEGMQWTGDGTLYTWIDDRSVQTLNRMNRCNVNKYSGYCPLQGSSFDIQCVDGQAAVGQAFADNGGVIAAYRAFRNTQSYRKPDLRLPNPMAGQLTPDQVFFMSYSQTMCQTTPKQAELYKQLVLDQAAPQNTRVMGAVQHLQQFTTAFNCPVWSVEAQRNLAKNRCNIWNNEVNAVTGTPPTTTTLPNLNVPMRLDQNSSRYVEVADRIANLVDTTQDVCNNFYQYACGPFGKHYENPFLEAAEYKSFEQLAAALKTNSPTSDNYNRVSNAKSFYNSCIDNIKDIQSQSRNNIFASDYIDTFNGETGVPFPLMESPDNEYKFSSLDSSYMGYALGWLSGHMHLDTFFSIFVDANWADPSGKQPFAIYVDQPQMVLPRHFYHGDRWSIIQSLYQADIEQILTAYITNTTTNNANQTAVREVAASIVDLEATLAQYQFTGDEDDYLNYLGAYQPKIIGQLKDDDFVNVNMWYFFYSLLRHIPSFDLRYQLCCSETNRNRTIFTNFRRAQRMDRALSDDSRYFTAEQVYNYLNYRVIVDTHQRLGDYEVFPNLADKFGSIPVIRRKSLGRPRFEENLHTYYWNNWLTSLSDAEITCTNYVQMYLPELANRIYLDNVFPSARKDATGLRDEARIIVENVALAWKEMINQLSWLRDLPPWEKMAPGREYALNKITQMVRNVGFNDSILDDDYLHEKYRELGFHGFHVYLDRINYLTLSQQWVTLISGDNSQTRQSFDGYLTMARSWYNPQLNSITIPFALLQPPFFDVDYPSVVNYAFLGSEVGKAIAQAFDQDGQQFDGIGSMVRWMTWLEKDYYYEMVDCLADQYGAFCPLKDSYSPFVCVDAGRTMKAILAENGGTRAAFLAYKNSQGTGDVDHVIPNNLARQYTNDQLFFLAFAQSKCEYKPDPDNTWSQFALSSGFPREYSVLGTLQNMQEFRTIFNCPVGSTYAPRPETCNVWTSEVKPVTGAPPTTTTLPPININVQNWWYSDTYAELSDQLEHNIDASRSPCTYTNYPHFYNYACGSSSDYRTPLERSTFNAYRVTQRALSNTDRREIEPVEMAKRFYSMCRDRDQAFGYNNTFAMLYYTGFRRASRLPFPAFDRPDTINWPSPQQLGRGIGFLSGQAFMDTLLSFKVDTNWVDPDGTEPYLLYVDQSNLWYSLLYYKNTTWESEDYLHNDTVRGTLYKFANLTKTNISWDEIQVAADDFLRFEQSLANNFITDKAIRDRNYTRSFNLVTVSEANQKYPFFDFHEYFMALVIPPGAGRGTVDNRLANKVSNPNFKFVTMEPNQLQNMNNAFRDNNNYGFTPRQLLNYLYVRVILENSEYIGRPQSSSNQPSQQLSRKFLNRFASRINPNAKFTERSVGSIEHDGLIESYDCVKLTISAFEYPTARLFIDALSAQTPNIDNLLQSAQGLFSNVVYAFRTMLDQILWMTPLERTAAEAKLDNMVISFGYPERIRDDRYLFAYYRSFRPRSTSNFVSFAIEIAKFNYAKKFSYLLRTNGVDRQEFNGLIFEPASWYQPQLNSLVLSATLVLPPFYKPDGPDAVNYGGIGFFIGRALVQAFGDVGVQFDESGALAPWLGQESSQNLLDQSQCLIREYGRFCPINDMQYNLQCVDGEHTLGENIADSGGLLAAFRAYRNHVEARGGTNSLPGNLVGQYTGDQLFFLSFAQPFCQAPPLDYRTFEQYLLPGVVPPQYRVTGAVLNNHAFQDAFLCLPDEGPFSSAYRACNIWITDSPARQQIPPPSLVNIPTPRTIKKDEMLFDDYKDAQSYFKASMNLKADPCNNFYEYTCANYQGPLGFSVFKKDNYKNIANMIDKLSTNTASSAVNKLKLFFNTCVSALSDFSNRIRDGKAITDRIQKFAQSSTFTFTLMSSPDVPITEKLDSATLAKALVYLSSNESIDTLLTVVVDGTLDNSINDYPYRLFIDQNTLTYPKAYYTDAAWKVTRPKFLSNVATVLRRHARLVGSSTSDNAINTYAGRIVDFEKLLASPLYSTDDITRRDISRWENEWGLSDADQQMPNFDWRTYISAILDFAGIPSSEVIDHIYTYFREPDRFKQLAQDLSDTTKIDPDLVVNYLFTRILIQNAQLVPDPDSNAGNLPNSGFVPVTTDDRQFVHEKLEDRLRPDPFVDVDLTEPRLECVKQTVNMMKLANAKVFTDNQFPPQGREDIKRNTHNIFLNVRRAFRAMIDDVDWIRDRGEKAEKTGVLAKATSVQMNLGYDDFQITDAQLDEHYTPLFFDDGNNEPFVPDNYFAMVMKLKQFNQFSKWKLINDMDDHHLYIARSQFVGAPANLESWYSRINSSITLPEGLLREPYYNQNWPTSVNYGSMGFLIAHEFSHALDDLGVQFNSDGIFSRQLTDENLNSFNNMAKCVVDEYNNFKVLDENRYSPNTINGEATQGENIADIAGLRAAFRAYRNHVALNGPDPQLPDRMLRQLTHDQLFFLSFARLWCQGPPSDDEMYQHILSESHSPPQYRVFGAIQNNPAFRSAFNCPLGSNYAPENYCKVWTPINAN